MVVNGCLADSIGTYVDSIELVYTEKVNFASGESTPRKVVLRYSVDPTLPLNEVVAPLDPDEAPPSGMRLDYLDRKLLREVLTTSTEVGVDGWDLVNATSVVATGDGSYVALWDPSMSTANSFVSDDEVKSGVDDLKCDADGKSLSWVIPPSP